MQGSTERHRSTPLQPEDAFHRDAVHPSRRARVPGPPAASAVRRVVVDVPGEDVRLDLVALDLCAAAGVVHRVEHVEELDRLVAVPEARHREDDPRRGVRVLSAVLADARDVAFDVAGIDWSVGRTEA